MTTETVSAGQIYDEMLGHAESMKNDEDQTMGALSPTDFWRQGDVLIHYADSVDTIPGNLELEEMKKMEAQVAPGNTQGSRHILSDVSKIKKMWKVKNANPLQGPVIQTGSEPVQLTHPEHGNIELTADSVFYITYQRKHAEELARVKD